MNGRVLVIGGVAALALAVAFDAWWQLDVGTPASAPEANIAPRPVPPPTPIPTPAPVTTSVPPLPAAAATPPPPATPSTRDPSPTPVPSPPPPAMATQHTPAPTTPGSTSSGPTPAPAAPRAVAPVTPPPADFVQPSPPTGTDLPTPPMPPRVAQGSEYERCLAMVPQDPQGANALADAWEATGGGDGATHCRAAAQIALGNTEVGAELLERLARASKAPALARAFVYGQATQAWLMAGDAPRAYGTATMALALAPEDVDLLIDRSIAAATMERYMDAIDDLNLALDRDGRRTDALVFRAAAWRHEAQLDLAIDDIDRALKIDPDNPEALLERGILRQRRGDLAGASADWQRVVELAPDTMTADLAQQNLSLLEAGPRAR